MKHFSRFAFLLVALVLCGVLKTFAQKPSAPDTLMVNAKPNGDIYMFWALPDESTAPTSFKIYMATSATPDSAELFATLGADSLKILPNAFYYEYKFKVAAEGRYCFYVVPINDIGEGDRSKMQCATVGKVVTFSSYPSMEHVPVHTLYIYNALAAASDNSPVGFKLLNAPAGMAVSGEGKVTWTPTKSGVHSAILKAYMLYDTTKFATQEFRVIVRECDPVNYGGIVGRVFDQDGEQLMSGATVYAVRQSGKNLDSGVASVGTIDKQGYYYLPLDAGAYKMYVIGEKITTEWYNNVATRDSAQVLTVSCGKNDTLDITVEMQKYKNFTVSGRVTFKDSSTTWLDQTRVNFFPYDKKSLKPVLKAEVPGVWANPNGQYSITLSDKYHYIAKAVPTIIDSSSNDPYFIYAPQYFDHVNDINEATMLKLTGNISNVNFDLDSIPPFINSITGSIRDSANQLVDAVVTAYRIDADSSGYYTVAARSEATYGGGHFIFGHLTPGEYVLLVQPVSERYAQGYYLQNGEAVRFWQDATRITLGENDLMTNLDLRIPEITGQKASGIVRGRITGSKGVMRAFAKVAPPVAGALVYLTDNALKLHYQAHTDINGEFTVNNVAVGAYSMFVDKIGFETLPFKVMLLNPADSMRFDGEMTPMQLSLSVYENGEFLKGNIYPNPAASQQAIIEFPALGENVKIRIVNILGQDVFKTEIATTSGANFYTLQLAKIPSGTYSVIISENGKIFRLPALKVIR